MCCSSWGSKELDTAYGLNNSVSPVIEDFSSEINLTYRKYINLTMRRRKAMIKTWYPFRCPCTLSFGTVDQVTLTNVLFITSTPWITGAVSGSVGHIRRISFQIIQTQLLGSFSKGDPSLFFFLIWGKHFSQISFKWNEEGFSLQKSFRAPILICF